MARGVKRGAVESGPVQELWELPIDWKWRRARDFADIVGGGTPRNAADMANFSAAGTPWITPADLSRYVRPTISRGARSLSKLGLQNSAARLLPAGAVLISSRAPVGYSVVAESPLATSQGFKSLVLRGDVDPFYIRYYILRSHEYLQNNASGTTFKELSGAAMGELSFPIPSLETQCRIVTRIDELFAEIDDGDRALAVAVETTETYRRSLLKAAVTGALSSDWRRSNPVGVSGSEAAKRILDARREYSADLGLRKYDEPTACELAPRDRLPDGWAWMSLEQISSPRERSFQSGPFGSSLLHSEFQSTGKLVIGIDNVRDGYFSMGSKHRISDEKFRELERFSARPRDLLITVMSTIGRVCVVPDDVEMAIITKHLYRITCFDRVMDANFLSLCLRSHPETLSEIFGGVQGQTRPGLNKAILKRVPIPVPPLAEQREILARLKRLRIDGDGFGFESLNASSSRLRQSILAAAFRGDLVA